MQIDSCNKQSAFQWQKLMESIVSRLVKSKLMECMENCSLCRAFTFTAAPAVLPTGGKDVPFQALAPKELRNVAGNPKACWIVSSDFADGEL